MPLVALLLGNKKIVAYGLVAIGVFAWWQFDRAQQYRKGVAETKAAIEQAIAQSKELVSHEKGNAINAASAAARRVCEQALDASACKDL